MGGGEEGSLKGTKRSATPHSESFSKAQNTTTQTEGLV